MERLTEKYKEVKIIETEGDKIHIFNLWNDDSFFLRFDKNDDLSFLNDFEFPQELMAMYSANENFIEIFASPINPKLDLVKRKFKFYFKGVEYKCSWKTPTIYFEKIAKAFRENKEESKTSYRNLRQFRDFYRIDELPTFMSNYLEDKEPFNFFIEGDLSIINNQIVEFCKTLNFYMNYFDRETPNIQIFQKTYDKESYNLPCITIFDNFPPSINAVEIDVILLEIISVANYTNDIRLSFIFYYQILEYASYYFLKSDIKQKLITLLKRPDISYKSEEYSKNIIEEFKNHFKQNDDKAKLDSLISDHISLSDIKLELEKNVTYYSKKIEFDGGFTIEPIMKNEIIDINQLTENTIKAIKENIIGIRNSLVHLRESRENKVILPTAKNDDLLIPYLYLIRRICEKIIIDR